MDTHALAVSPSLPGTVFLANRMGLFRSPDRGETWLPMDIGRFSDLTYARDLKVFPHDPHTFLAALSDSAGGNAGSLYRSPDLGETWSRFDHDVSIDSTLMTLAASARTPERIYCAARRGQVFGTEDGGVSWQAFPLPDGVEGVYAIACASLQIGFRTPPPMSRRHAGYRSPRPRERASFVSRPRRRTRDLPPRCSRA